MDLVDAFASFEFARQARDAAVGGIGDFGEEKRNIEPQLVTHDAILFSWRSALRSVVRVWATASVTTTPPMAVAMRTERTACFELLKIIFHLDRTAAAASKRTVRKI